MNGGWREEFGAEYAVPAEIEELVKDGKLFDQSWHNDVSPSFSHVEAEPDANYDVRLWVEHPDPTQREGFGHEIAPGRFLVVDNADRNEQWFLATDNLTEALVALAHKAEQVAAKRKLIRDAAEACEVVDADELERFAADRARAIAVSQTAPTGEQEAWDRLIDTLLSARGWRAERVTLGHVEHLKIYRPDGSLAISAKRVRQ